MTDPVPTPEHLELARSVRQLLERRSDSRAVRSAMAGPVGFDTALWSTLCDQLGVAALAVPEECGGAGFTAAETHVVLEELGRALTPSPLLASVVTSAVLVAAGGADDLLERIAAGAVATLAWSGTTDTVAATVGVRHADGRLSGSVAPVLNGDAAEILLVAAHHDDGVGLFEVDPAAPGVHLERVSGMDPTSGFATLDLEGAPARLVAADATAALAAAHRAGTLATTALASGCARRGLDMTVGYTQQREQFGRPLASFQALKHRMADLLVLVQVTQAGAWAAVQAVVHDTPDADRLVASAASYAKDAVTAVAAETVQLHGGIAITWEHDAHLVFKRAQALNQLFGLPHHHRAALV
ncbi:acyl-CoA dehydrogenase, C-terminal domain protein [Aeromicrobium marinum DSM 15272]|uniref:Acyl-CoA dehydrogenase, C-terminal domain protein n=1 Tax=Aeromicrobium marinum DSM 15272 TaxID=585531 RepID=E2SES2_9ACTN|nr:acyl-CoA dehydrogenase family protein [Aeromicrobium marinum]EFQ82369.1 acyl-CoA dehydrogenase, C-terminal domain protein [Aeromicrobium marinum DSM 15272]